MDFTAFSLHFVCLALSFGTSFAILRHGLNDCSHPESVPYNRKVLKSKLVPFQQYSYFHGWVTKYRHQYVYEDEVIRICT